MGAQKSKCSKRSAAIDLQANDDEQEAIPSLSRKQERRRKLHFKKRSFCCISKESDEDELEGSKENNTIICEESGTPVRNYLNAIMRQNGVCLYDCIEQSCVSTPQTLTRPKTDGFGMTLRECVLIDENKLLSLEPAVKDTSHTTRKRCTEDQIHTESLRETILIEDVRGEMTYGVVYIPLHDHNNVQQIYSSSHSCSRIDSNLCSFDEENDTNVQLQDLKLFKHQQYEIAEISNATSIKSLYETSTYDGNVDVVSCNYHTTAKDSDVKPVAVCHPISYQSNVFQEPLPGNTKQILPLEIERTKCETYRIERQLKEKYTAVGLKVTDPQLDMNALDCVDIQSDSTGKDSIKTNLSFGEDMSSSDCYSRCSCISHSLACPYSIGVCMNLDSSSNSLLECIDDYDATRKFSPGLVAQDVQVCPLSEEAGNEILPSVDIRTEIVLQESLHTKEPAALNKIEKVKCMSDDGLSRMSRQEGDDGLSRMSRQEGDDGLSRMSRQEGDDGLSRMSRQEDDDGSSRMSRQEGAFMYTEGQPKGCERQHRLPQTKSFDSKAQTKPEIRIFSTRGVMLTESEEGMQMKEKGTQTEFEVTQTELEITQAEPETTMTEPETTMTEPETTMTEPETTMTEPETTMTEPETTMTELETTLTEPETTLTEPETSLTEPETTITEHETTVNKLEMVQTKQESIFTEHLSALETIWTAPDISGATDIHTSKHLSCFSVCGRQKQLSFFLHETESWTCLYKVDTYIGLLTCKAFEAFPLKFKELSSVTFSDHVQLERLYLQTEVVSGEAMICKNTMAEVDCNSKNKSSINYTCIRVPGEISLLRIEFSILNRSKITNDSHMKTSWDEKIEVGNTDNGNVQASKKDDNECKSQTINGVDAAQSEIYIDPRVSDIGQEDIPTKEDDSTDCGQDRNQSDPCSQSFTLTDVDKSNVELNTLSSDQTNVVHSDTRNRKNPLLHMSAKSFSNQSQNLPVSGRERESRNYCRKYCQVCHRKTCHLAAYRSRYHNRKQARYMQIIRSLVTTWYISPDPHYINPVRPHHSKTEQAAVNNGSALPERNNEETISTSTAPITTRHLLQEQGLQGYFESLSLQTQPSETELLSLEWLRLRTFSFYSGHGSAQRLAQNGFYNVHSNSAETRCFCCGTSVSDWGYFDNIQQRHSQESPQCPFVQGIDTVNVPVYRESPSVSSEASFEGTAVGPAVNRTEPVISETLTLPSSSSTQPAGNSDQSKTTTEALEAVPYQPVEDAENQQYPGRPTVQTKFSAEPFSVSALSRNMGAVSTQSAEPLSPSSVRAEQASQQCRNIKNPDFASLTTRVSSFQGWPSYLDQTPRQLGEAGFFYAGVADFARCFCCNGGLRNWEPGDDPLLEHTRWYPNCEYIRNLKGERFVEMIRTRQEAHMREQGQRGQNQPTPQQSLSSNQTSPPSTAVGTPDPNEQTETTSLLEMGYTVQRVKEAVIALRTRTGRTEVTAEEVLNFILEQEDQGLSIPPPGRRPDIRVVMNNEQPINSSGTEAQVHSNQDTPTTVNPTQAVITTTAATATSTTVGWPLQAHPANQNAATGSTGLSTSQGPRDNNGGQKGSSTTVAKKKTKQNKKSKSQERLQGSENTSTNAASGGASSHIELDPNSLKEENKKLKEMQLCKVCLDNPVAVTFLPCGHLVCCEKCAPLLRHCPICRVRIKGTIKTYMA